MYRPKKKPVRKRPQAIHSVGIEVSPIDRLLRDVKKGLIDHNLVQWVG
jgi:hypothetical protein